MPNEHIEETLLDQYAMGTVPRASVAQVEEHILICSLCQSRLVAIDEFLTVFRSAALPADEPTPSWISVFRFRRWLWSGTAAAISLLLILVATGDLRKVSLPPAIVLMQSLRGPEDGARMSASRPCLLVFDLDLPRNKADYEIEIVDAAGEQVIRKDAEVKNGRLAILVRRLAPGSYWVRVYRKQDSELRAEYSLQSE